MQRAKDIQTEEKKTRGNTRAVLKHLKSRGRWIRLVRFGPMRAELEGNWLTGNE